MAPAPPARRRAFSCARLLRGAAQERGAGEKSAIGARAAATGIVIVSAVTDMPPGDAPPRRTRAALPTEVRLLLSSSAVSSSTVSPRSGPSTSPRRRAWSRRPAARRARRPGTAGCSTCRSGGWRGAAGPATWEMATMMYEPRKDDTRSRSYVRRPFAFLFFFPSPGAERRRLSGGAGAEMCGG